MLDKPRTPGRTLLEARRIAMRQGLRYVYTGNVHDEGTQTTWCHGCGAALVGRDWHAITAWGLPDDGRGAGAGRRARVCSRARPAAGARGGGRSRWAWAR